MKYYFFIVDDVESSNPSDLPKGDRVFALAEKVAFPPKNQFGVQCHPIFFDGGNGPYKSIEELKNESEIFRNLIKQDPKRASKLFEPQFLVIIDKYGYAAYSEEDDAEYKKLISPLIIHTAKGTFNKGYASGIHFYDPKIVKIMEHKGEKDQNGVWEAYIEVFNSNTHKWVEKRETSTFFPKKWSLLRIVEECKYAYQNKIKISETRYEGQTKSGVSVVFILGENMTLKTVYPIRSDS